MKKLVSVIVVIVVLTSMFTAFAASDWTQLDNVSWRWPTAKMSGGSGLALVDWDKLPTIKQTGRVYKSVATGSHWAVTYGGAPSTHTAGVLSGDDDAFTSVTPIKAHIDDADALVALGYNTSNLDALMSFLGRDALRHNDGLTGIAAISSKQGIRLVSWKWSDGSVGAFYKTPDNRIAIGVNWATGSGNAAGGNVDPGMVWNDNVDPGLVWNDTNNGGASNNGNGQNWDSRFNVGGSSDNVDPGTVWN